MDLAHWVNLPLQVSDQLLGSLGLGLSPARAAPDEQLPFLQALAERAARGFANTQLISELRRTRERLERILGVLAEAVTVQDERGQARLRQRRGGDAAGRRVGRGGAGRRAGRAGRALHHHARGRHAGARRPTCRASGCWPARSAPTLLTRSVVRETGRVYWLLTKATRLDDGGTLAVNIIEDVTEAKTAERRQRFLAEAGRAAGRHAATTSRRSSTSPRSWCRRSPTGARSTSSTRRATSSASRSSTTTPKSAARRRAARALPAAARHRPGARRGAARRPLDARRRGHRRDARGERARRGARPAAARARDALGDARRAAGARADTIGVL